jgi:hypothetical protein
MLRTLILSFTAVLLLSSAAFAQASAQGGADDQGPSGVITLEQLKDMQSLIAQKEGVVVNFVLPQSWEVVEEGIDPKTKKVREDLNVYSLLSRRPVADPQEPTDFIFELDIYKHGLLEGLPADVKPEEATAAAQFKRFLDLQMSINLKGGLKVVSKPADIVPKLYGPDTRPKTVFVPIFYKTPGGAMLYTFTSVITDTYHFSTCPYFAKSMVTMPLKDAAALGYGPCMLCQPREKDGTQIKVDPAATVYLTHSGPPVSKVWQLKFLVSEDQVDNYSALISMLLYNAFGVTEGEFKGLEANSKTGK